MDSGCALYLLPLLAGLLNPVQSGANGTLNGAIEAPAVVALVALALASATMALAGLALGKLSVPVAEKAASAPMVGLDGRGAGRGRDHSPAHRRAPVGG